MELKIFASDKKSKNSKIEMRKSMTSIASYMLLEEAKLMQIVSEEENNH